MSRRRSSDAPPQWDDRLQDDLRRTTGGALAPAAPRKTMPFDLSWARARSGEVHFGFAPECNMCADRQRQVAHIDGSEHTSAITPENARLLGERPSSGMSQWIVILSPRRHSVILSVSANVDAYLATPNDVTSMVVDAGQSAVRTALVKRDRARADGWIDCFADGPPGPERQWRTFARAGPRGARQSGVVRRPAMGWATGSGSRRRRTRG
jgi:hypothetical protein